eukprot:4961920-Lingulodinium_polyedra.AAC.1
MMLVADQGREFIGAPLTDMCDRLAILFHVVDVRVPWQNGRTERRDDLFKKVLTKAAWLYEPPDLEGKK